MLDGYLVWANDNPMTEMNTWETALTKAISSTISPTILQLMLTLHWDEGLTLFPFLGSNSSILEDGNMLEG